MLEKDIGTSKRERQAQGELKQRKTVQKITIWVQKEEVEVSDVPSSSRMKSAEEGFRSACPLRKENGDEVQKTTAFVRSEKKEDLVKMTFANTIIFFVVTCLILSISLCLSAITLFAVMMSLNFGMSDSEILRKGKELYDFRGGIAIMVVIGSLMVTGLTALEMK